MREDIEMCDYVQVGIFALQELVLLIRSSFPSQLEPLDRGSTRNSLYLNAYPRGRMSIYLRLLANSEIQGTGEGKKVAVRIPVTL